MGFNPYGTIAQVADVFGADDFSAAARVGDRTQRRVQQTGGRIARTTGGVTRGAGNAISSFNPHQSRGAIAGRGTPSLPGIRQGGRVTGQGARTDALKDSKGNVIRPPYISPIGSPSIRVTERPDGGVDTVVVRNSIYVSFIPQVYWDRLQRIVTRMVRRAEQLSRGRLSLKELRKRNHPYGHGLYASVYKWKDEDGNIVVSRTRKRRGLGRLTRLRGVSNMAVVNRQSGDFAASWFGIIERGRLGIRLKLSNLSEHAKHLLGTTKMRAHGPFLTAVQLYLAEFDRVWRAAARAGYEAMLRRFETRAVAR